MIGEEQDVEWIKQDLETKYRAGWKSLLVNHTPRATKGERKQDGK